MHEVTGVPVLQTIIQAWPIEPLPAFTVLDDAAGGLQDGKFSGAPWTLFAELHPPNAGTSGTRTGLPPTGRS